MTKGKLSVCASFVTSAAIVHSDSDRIDVYVYVLRQYVTFSILSSLSEPSGVEGSVVFFHIHGSPQ